MTLSEPRWISRAVLEATHADLLNTFGGLPGVWDEAALDSAVMRAQQKFFYSDPSFEDLCAAYGFGFAKNHPFNDGNKRTAFAAMMIFARFNGKTIKASEEEVVRVMLAVASSGVDEEYLATWLKDHLVPFSG